MTAHAMTDYQHHDTMTDNQYHWDGTDDEITADLGHIWELLRSNKEQSIDWSLNHFSYELIIVQCVLVALLVVVCVCWALYCKKRSTNPTVVEALNKLSSQPSKDLLPSSNGGKDQLLHQAPDSNHEDSLQYLDLEAGHRRMSRLSFGSSDGVPSRISVGSCASCSGRTSRSSLSSSRRESTAATESKQSFSEENSLRRLSSNTLFNLLSHYNSTSRKQSETTDTSRKSSSIYQVQRKNASNHSDVVIDKLDEKLQQKLSRIENPETEPEPATQTRVCHIIAEER